MRHFSDYRREKKHEKYVNFDFRILLRYIMSNKWWKGQEIASKLTFKDHNTPRNPYNWKIIQKANNFWMCKKVVMIHLKFEWWFFYAREVSFVCQRLKNSFKKAIEKSWKSVEFASENFVTHHEMHMFWNIIKHRSFPFLFTQHFVQFLHNFYENLKSSHVHNFFGGGGGGQLSNGFGL